MIPHAFMVLIEESSAASIGSLELAASELGPPVPVLEVGPVVMVLLFLPAMNH